MKSLPSINPKLETGKIVNFLKKTFMQQKIDKVVLGLSGGIDSTVALYLLKKALPPKNIFAVQMDYKQRKEIGIDLEGVGVNVVNMPITKITNGFKESLVRGESGKFFATWDLPLGEGSHGAKKFATEPLTKARLGNIMARIRMIILFDLAKQLGALVCGTENKSEKLLGYFTRFGDEASDIEPISHLYKTQIYQLAKYLKVPKKIINQSPTAGLWSDQTDENDFGFTYKEADQVLYLTHDCGQDINKVKKEFPNAEKIIKRILTNKFKHEVPYKIT